MRYINSTLLRDEIVTYATRPHWIIFTPGVCLLLLTLYLLYSGPGLFSVSMIMFGLPFYKLVSLVVFVVGAYSFIGAIIQYNTSEYVCTNKRIIMKTGWIRRNALEIFLDKLEAINVDQSVLGRILDYGIIIIVGTGGTADPFNYIPNPLAFRKRVQQQMENYEHPNEIDRN